MRSALASPSKSFRVDDGTPTRFEISAEGPLICLAVLYARTAK